MTLVNRLVAGPTPPAGPVSVKLQLLDYDTGQELFAKDFAGITLSAEPVEEQLPIANAPLLKNLLARATVTTADGKTQVYEGYRHAPAVMGTEKLYKTIRPVRVRPVERPDNIVKTLTPGIPPVASARHLP